MTAANRDSSDGGLRSGWTTGACAAAAAKAAWTGYLGGAFPDPVRITLPCGQQPRFSLELHEKGDGWARAGIIKDAGDDPDVTHGALIIARVAPGMAGGGVVFRAGEGVGTITRPGLPLDIGEAAINPVPRRMIARALAEAQANHGGAVDVEVEISVPGGEAMARRTLNPRLGILGGISILGTTGIVTPYSCSAWIHSIHRGIDVARAMGYDHVAASIGATSEKMVQAKYDLPEAALIDMGDFIGGTLKYLRGHPVARLSLAGGFGKMSKLAAGHLDVHSKRCRVDMEFLARLMDECGAAAEQVAQTRAANTALEVWRLAEAAGLPLADRVADHARAVAMAHLKGAPVALEVLICSREGRLIGLAGN
jgi:cobalt-precorrin-5B (C1)-methyltransferase